MVEGETITPIDRYWQQFLASLPDGAQKPEAYYEAAYFGVAPEDAASINPLVLAGTKTASGSILWSYEAEGRRPPRPGNHSVVTDGFEAPVCIIRTKEVRVLPFEEVDAAFAFDGGEWDRTLESWRKAYWGWVVSVCAGLGREPTPRTPLVCERFEVVYRRPLCL
jgi:uncharacterized protein YhfF